MVLKYKIRPWIDEKFRNPRSFSKRSFAWVFAAPASGDSVSSTGYRNYGIHWVHLCNASRIMQQREWFAQSQELATIGGSREHSTDHTVKRLVRKISVFLHGRNESEGERSAIVRESGESPQLVRHFVRAFVLPDAYVARLRVRLLLLLPSSSEERSRFQK